MTSATCHGCIHVAKRFRGSSPQTWCKRFHRPVAERCLDYISKAGQIKAAMRFYKAAAIKS